jgi:hypothetical protein
LKVEGLFEYLEMRVYFIDERTLAPSYTNYEFQLRNGNKIEEKNLDGEKVFLPTRELRKEMSELLQSEVDKITEEELIRNMNRIRKGSLEEYRRYNLQK